MNVHHKIVELIQLISPKVEFAGFYRWIACFNTGLMWVTAYSCEWTNLLLFPLSGNNFIIILWAQIEMNFYRWIWYCCDYHIYFRILWYSACVLKWELIISSNTLMIISLTRCKLNSIKIHYAYDDFDFQLLKHISVILEKISHYLPMKKWLNSLPVSGGKAFYLFPFFWRFLSTKTAEVTWWIVWTSDALINKIPIKSSSFNFSGNAPSLHHNVHS